VLFIKETNKIVPCSFPDEIATGDINRINDRLPDLPRPLAAAATATIK
jgi:hypothetical protein